MLRGPKGVPPSAPRAVARRLGHECGRAPITSVPVVGAPAYSAKGLDLGVCGMVDGTTGRGERFGKPGQDHNRPVEHRTRDPGCEASEARDTPSPDRRSGLNC